ncbi:hypothetical protein HDC94_000300 [Leifsonia sp. AK011]|uniref:hypothetical protein n=1 Tax=Leifsonia sp. AK011 TaxID=2723075 RepID=UPI0015C9CDC0|nr:hypothetical protein [Leifsonia sp. AK011]NYF09144.1 hypothetical protein [Leifsonia sp. AK011]
MKISGSPPSAFLQRAPLKVYVIAAAACLAGAAVVLTVATTMVVHGDEEARKEQAAVIEPESNATDSPESVASEATLEVPGVVGLPRDPLTNDEVAYARSLASLDPSFVAATGDDGRKPVYLSTTISEPEAYTDDARRFEVVYYSYSDNKTMRYIVNVSTGVVELAEAASSVQPPPAQSEVDEAYELLLDSPVSEVVKQAFFATEGTKLTDPSQTTYNASSFVATPGSIGAEECGVDRCLMLLVQTPDGTYLPTTGIAINLTQQTVLEIN